MLKLQAVKDYEPESTIKIRLVQEDNSIIVAAETPTNGGDDYWHVAELRVNDGKLIMVINTGIADDLIDTDQDGRIKNVEE